MLSLTPKVTPGKALSILTTVVTIAFVITALREAREVLIPIALAALFTFLLAPVVSKLERKLGRVMSVLLVVLWLCATILGAGWVITGQFVDLAKQLPGYKENIISKVHGLPHAENGVISSLEKMVNDLRKEFSRGDEEKGAGEAKGAEPAKDGKAPQSAPGQPPQPMPVKVVPSGPSTPLEMAETALKIIAGPLGTAALILLLLTCMLLQREDLRNRFIRLLGQQHIGATSRAMDDAAQRVSRYLLMQLVVNVCYGVVIAVGLTLLHVPNAMLWGALSTVLRFVPYVGAWIAAAFPLILSLAVSKDWMMPSMTLALFAGVELLCGNVAEPLVYGSSTGISSMAVILSAVFWTWIWGPVGLIMATPLTVCLVVIGHHIPHLGFLKILLSDEQALTPAEDLYHRLLTPRNRDEVDLAEFVLKKQSLTDLYDQVMMPALAMSAEDADDKALPPEHLVVFEQGFRDLMADLEDGTVPRPKEAPPLPEGATAVPPLPPCHLICVPARSTGDELAGLMLSHLLREQNCEITLLSGDLVTGELMEKVEEFDAEIICISAVLPAHASQARYLCLKMRHKLPDRKILVGLWGKPTPPAEVLQRLREAGADEVVTTLPEAMTAIRRLAPRVESGMTAAAIPANDGERIAALHDLNLLTPDFDKRLDDVTENLTRLFEAPIGLVSLVDEDRIYFKSHRGLSEALSGPREAPRDVSVCGHVVAANEMIVVEDLARDPRFANNPWLREHGMRFYAGAPLHGPNGHAIGSLCIIDHKPRRFTEQDEKQLQEYADKMTEELRTVDGHKVRSFHPEDPR